MVVLLLVLAEVSWLLELLDALPARLLPSLRHTAVVERLLSSVRCLSVSSAVAVCQQAANRQSKNENDDGEEGEGEAQCSSLQGEICRSRSSADDDGRRRRLRMARRGLLESSTCKH